MNYFTPNMRYNFLMPYIITPNRNLLSPTMHFNIQTHHYQLTWPSTNVKSSRGKKKIIKLCSCVTSIACSNSILNFKIEVQNSTCTRDRLNYGHIMQTLPHSLCSFHYPHGKKITRLRVKDDIPLTLTCLKHLFFVFNSDPFIAGTG